MSFNFDAVTTRKFVDLLMRRHTDGESIELAAIDVEMGPNSTIVRGKKYHGAFAGWFDDPDKFIGEMMKARDVNLFLTPNPARKEVAHPETQNTLWKPPKDATKRTADEHVSRLLWLFIDVDAKRPADTSSTDEELAEAIALRDRIIVEEPALVDSAAYGRSGNGCWILVPIDLPNDGQGRDAVRKAIVYLSATYQTGKAGVDSTTFNPSRLMGVPGARKCKGETSTPDRPWRLSGVDGWPIQVVPLDLPHWLEGKVIPEQLLVPDAVRDDAPQDDFLAFRKAQFVQGAIDAELAKLRSTQPGGRNKALNSAAHYLGQLVGAGAALRPQIEELIRSAALSIGLSPAEIEGTMRSGLDSGERKPRDLSEFDAPPEPQAPAPAAKKGKAKEPKPKLPKGEGKAPSFADGLTDLGNARRLQRGFGEGVRFCEAWKKWLCWDGTRWKAQGKLEVPRLAHRLSVLVAEEIKADDDEETVAAIRAWADHCESAKVIRDAIDLFRALDGQQFAPEELDHDPWLLNCANGTLDLRTGILRPHERADRITKLCPTPYVPDAPAPCWEATLDLFIPDDDVRGFVHRFAGYSLTGVVRDQILPIFHGEKGNNGKSTILNMLMDVMGEDYAIKAQPSMLLVDRHASHPTERADLFGVRLAVAIESRKEQHLNAPIVKELTGNDKIRARKLYQDSFQFDPTHKLILATNHVPKVDAVDAAIWRRIALVPFPVRLPDQEADTSMPEKLKAEAPGILAWMVRGCREWVRRGLDIPTVMVEATQQYKSEQDALAPFFEECVVLDPDLWVMSSHLYTKYKDWATENGEKVLAQSVLGKMLKERGIQKKHKDGYVKYFGIAVKTATPPLFQGTPYYEAEAAKPF